MAVAGIALAVVAATLALGAPAAPKPAASWAIELPNASASAADLARLRKHGLQTLILDRARTSPAVRAEVAGRARRAGVRVAFPRTDGAGLETSCRADRRGPAGTCAVFARSPKRAVTLARRNAADFVVLRLRGLGQLRFLRGLKTNARIVAVARLPQRELDRSTWSRAIAMAAADSSLDLAVSVRSVSQPALGPYVSLLSGAPATPRASGPTRGIANLWVDPSGGSCKRSATPTGYADLGACRSINAAYQAASAGDVILMKGGTYSNQPDILNRSSLAVGSVPVVLHPAPGENVSTDSFDIRAHDFVLDGGDTVRRNEPNRFTVTGDGSRSIDVENVNVIVEDVHTRNFYFASTGDNSTLRYSEVGPSSMNLTPFCGDLVLTERVSNAVVEYNLIHDNLMAGCNGAHIDALDLNMDNGVIRGNRIWSCGTQCIFTGDPGSMLIENNMIEETNSCDDCGGPAELALMGTNVVRYNTIEGADGYGLPDRPGNSTVYGNIFLDSYDRCTWGPNVTVSYSHNVFGGGRGCGADRRVCRPRLADGKLYTDVDRKADYHLHPTDTCARGAGNAGAHPQEDLDEERRPQGSAVDAGADER